MAVTEQKGTVYYATGDESVAGLDWAGGSGTFAFVGTFPAGASASLEASFDGTNYFPVGDDTSVTVDGGGRFHIAACKLSVALDGDTVPSGNWYIASDDNIKRMV